jgi:hypothetical protein
VRHGPTTVDRSGADHVVDGHRPGGDPHHDEAQPAGHLEHHRHEPGAHPAQLEPGLELGERPAAVGIGRVALHDRLERESADRRGEAHRAGQQHAGDHPTEQRRAEPGDRDHGQRCDEHRLFAQLRAHERGDCVAGHRQQACEAERETEPDEAGLLCTEPEEQVEEREPGAGPQEQQP